MRPGGLGADSSRVVIRSNQHHGGADRSDAGVGQQVRGVVGDEGFEAAVELREGGLEVSGSAGEFDDHAGGRVRGACHPLSEPTPRIRRRVQWSSHGLDQT